MLQEIKFFLKRNNEIIYLIFLSASFKGYKKDKALIKSEVQKLMDKNFIKYANERINSRSSKNILRFDK